MHTLPRSSSDPRRQGRACSPRVTLPSSQAQGGPAVATKRLRRHNRRTTALVGLVLSTGLCLGALASATPAAAAPSISFAPTSGAAGTRVLITESGAGFGKVT